MVLQAHTLVVIRYRGVEMAAIVVRTGRRRKHFPPRPHSEFAEIGKALKKKLFLMKTRQGYSGCVFRIFLVTL
ncbi:hypothetical protein C0Q87_08240 [Klebsiella aerogenes]|nr:hypothetical protein C0Q87_08240 [Klebsiella aerogenes]